MAKPTFEPIEFAPIDFNIAYKIIQTEGFIANEYNPFHNLRLSKDRYEKSNLGRYQIVSGVQSIDARLNIIRYKKIDGNYTPIEYSIYIIDNNLYTEFYISSNNPDYIISQDIETVSPTKIISDFAEYNALKKYTPEYLFKPSLDIANPKLKSYKSKNQENKFIITNYAGELVDFTTKDLKLDINHPVDIEVQESYDGSVNLILNDDLNPPKIINSRFTPLEEGRYKVVDRAGNNDTNIYDENTLTGDTNLYKSITQLPTLSLKYVQGGGQLKVGNYVFYFKYVDSDGNETDFVAESGIVSLFLGNLSDPLSSKGALLDTDSQKMVSFVLNYVDEAYNYVNVYYTRSTGTPEGTEITKAYKVTTSYVVRNGSCNITVTGIEQIEEITLEEINVAFNIVNKAKAQAQIQNRLFFGNVDKVTIPYEELSDLSLRITPEIYQEESIGYVNEEYTDNTPYNAYEYYNVNNIYYRLGYWEDIYRFGIVYILNDFTLSPVFNIKGIDLAKVDSDKDWSTKTPIYERKDNELKRVFIEVSDEGFISSNINRLENARGVVRLAAKESIVSDTVKPIGIKFNFQGKTKVPGDVDLVTELKKYTKGFFIVRQKRIPTVYCQGISIGLDTESKLPLVPIGVWDNKANYMTESFLAEYGNKLLVLNDFQPRIRKTDKGIPNAAIIPEAEINQPYYNNIFNGSDFTIRYSSFQPVSNHFVQSNNERHYYISGYKSNIKNMIYKPDVNLTYVNDNIQLIYSNGQEYSSRAGAAEEAYKVSYFESEDLTQSAKNLLRGAWGTYIGTSNLNKVCTLFDVMIPGYRESLLQEYFQARMDLSAAYFPICNRTAWENIFVADITDESRNIICYRGDCFIGNFTHRMCRNFQDPESPTNDTIVDENTWYEHYKGYQNGALVDQENLDKINRGDLNAVQIGHWITFKCMTNINFANRVVDDLNGSEVVLNGHGRGWYPIINLTPRGEYKLPDSSLFNKGLNSTTSDKYNYILPNVPYIKNEFANRIMYSDIHITDAFKNSYRTFKLNNFKDYSKENGALVTIEDWFGDLMVIFERGVGILPINERVAMNQSNNRTVSILSDEVLPERPIMLSKIYGTQWKDSIVKTQRFVYGIDTVGKKIWRTNGQTFEIISDFKIQKFLNDNISLSERERTPLLGIRNVKAHYNEFKQDVMFTFYDDVNKTGLHGENITSLEWNLCYNELLGKWVTKFSWLPLVSENISNVYFSYNKNEAKNISAVSSSWTNSYTSKGITIEDCYSKNKPKDVTSYILEDLLSKVTYPGVEFPYINGDGTEHLLGMLVFKLDLAEHVNNIKYTIDSLDDYPLGKYFTFKQSENTDTGKIETYIYYTDSPELKDMLIKNKEGVEGKGLFYATFKIRAELIREGTQDNIETKGQLYTDIVSVRLNHSFYNIFTDQGSSWFYRHGQAGIFDTTDKILPAYWYREQHPFEFEFIVNPNIGYQKIYDNLQIISNNVWPYEIDYEIIGDNYEFAELKEIAYRMQRGEDVSNENKYLKFSNCDVDYNEDFKSYSIRHIEELKDITGKIANPKTKKKYNLRTGNSRYKEDKFNIMIDPIRYQYSNNTNNNKSLKTCETRPRDKFLKIRVKYTGDRLVAITALQTLYQISLA